MKVLLTGSSGFLGQNLRPILEREYKVFGNSSRFYDLRKKRECEILVDHLEPDVIIHAARS